MDLTDWEYDVLHSLLADPDMYMPEIIGGAILLWFAAVLMRRKEMSVFIRTGQFS